MKRPSFAEGTALALALSIVTSLLYVLTLPFIDQSTQFRLMISGLGFVYTLYLLLRTPHKVGRITTLSLWGLATLIIWLMQPSLSTHLLLHVALIWVVRSLHFYSSLISALGDLALSGIGAIALLVALFHTGSILLAIWCFFLLQALFSVIPVRGAHRVNNPDSQADRFRQAEQSAEKALRRLASLH